MKNIGIQGSATSAGLGTGVMTLFQRVGVQSGVGDVHPAIPRPVRPCLPVSTPRSVRLLALLSAAALLSSAVGLRTAGAQRRDADDGPSGRGSVGVHLLVSEPRGDFARNTDHGFGIGGYVLSRLDPHGILNLRGDLALLSYGNSTRRIPLSGTGGLVQLDLRTSNNIVSFVAGPQLLGPSGAFTPYATALAGFSVFWTTSSVEGSSNPGESFASTTNASDAVWAYGAAAGSYIRLSRGRHPVRLDVGARFLRHDDVRYLNDERVREAYLTDRPPVPVRGRADFLTYYLGINAVAF